MIPKLRPFVACENEELSSLALRLLLNLSFDFELRQKMVDNGLLPKVALMLGTCYLLQIMLKRFSYIYIKSLKIQEFTKSFCTLCVNSLRNNVEN